MLFRALACDFDGTIAENGSVVPEVIARLSRLRDSGRRLILVTGRQLDELLSVFPSATIFDRVVAENGAILYNPATREELVLCAPPPARFMDSLKSLGIAPVSAGKVIVATSTPHETRVLQLIRELGLEMQIIFNKGAVMVLPSGVNKASGLQAALSQLGLSRHNAIAVGDAENDHAMFSFCECSVAVANALPFVREHADLVMKGAAGAGVCELIDLLLCDELDVMHRASGRHQVCLGVSTDQKPVSIDINCRRIIICGPSGSGKTLLALALVEQLAALEYQVCLIDPERDFDELSGAVVLGDSRRAPALTEISNALANSDTSVVISLLGVPHDDRPGFFTALVPTIKQLSDVYGRPHWFIADEAHYLMPSHLPMPRQSEDPLPLRHSLLITVHPDHLNRSVLQGADVVIATPVEAQNSLRRFCAAIGEEAPDMEDCKLPANHYLFWDRASGRRPVAFQSIRPHQEHHRHLRKYAEGDLGAYHSFYFTGPERRLNLKAQNLQMFVQLLEGIDDDTWLYHLRRHDYSRWFRGSIRDDGLANESTRIENDPSLSAAGSREKIAAAIHLRYSAPA